MISPNRMVDMNVPAQGRLATQHGHLKECMRHSRGDRALTTLWDMRNSTAVVRSVPITANKEMVPKFLKKSRFFRVKPVGQHTS